MRFILLALPLVLAACQPAPAPTATSTPTTTTAPAPSGTPLATGEMGAMSNTAMSLTGNLTVSATALTFEKGFTASTDYLGLVDATTLIAAGGQSFADAAPRPSNSRVEVRRLTGAAPTQLCDAPGASYVALVTDEPLTTLTLIFFSGADQPGAAAHDSAVCATFSYAVD